VAGTAVAAGIEAQEAIIGQLGPRQRVQLRSLLRSLLAAAGDVAAQR